MTSVTILSVSVETRHKDQYPMVDPNMATANTRVSTAPIFCENEPDGGDGCDEYAFDMDDITFMRIDPGGANDG
jgi:hypothetical protein